MRKGPIDIFIEEKHSEIVRRVDAKDVENISNNALNVALELSLLSYDEEKNRTSKIDKTANGLLTAVSFLFAAFIVFVTAFVSSLDRDNILIFQYFLMYLICKETKFLISSVIMLLITIRYRKYNCFASVEEQVKGVYQHIFDDSGKLRPESLRSKAAIVLNDLDDVSKKVCKINDLKNILTYIGMGLISLFTILFGISILIFVLF